jgi:hypothetical protein
VLGGDCCVASTYRVVVNHNTTLNITNLHILHTRVIPIIETASPLLFNTGLTPETHVNPG